ncbi:MAG: alcohol dehydrogenase catalytic domain-containing protein [Geminicoccaceae bacterium]
MRAVRLHGVGDLRVEEVADPALSAPDDVLLHVEAAGICGSDLHNYRTGQWLTRTPSTPGHELAGRVLATGPAAQGLAVGDLVVADSRYWCGLCPACTRGARHLCQHLGYVGEVCDGGFAESVVLPGRLLHKAGAVTADIASLAEPLAVALHAIARLGPPTGPVLVTGCGPIGGLAALLLRRRGADVVVGERNEARRDLVCAVTGAAPTDLTAAADVSFALEATGSTAVLDTLVRTLPAGSRLVLVGIFHGTLPFDPNLIVERELTVTGCSAFADELPEAIALLPDLTPDLRRFQSAPIALDAVPAAYADLIAGKARHLKTLLRPNI